MDREPIRIVWKNLTCDVQVTSKRYFLKNSEKTRVLNSMNGQVSSGTMTALMGPSGAGKTTLLNTITNKLRHGLGGDVLFQSSSINWNMRIGFVPQNNHLFMQFTVRETLKFASSIMNPNFNCDEHNLKISDVLQSLDINNQADQRLGKLSGGQLKRICIATEMISSPRILVLDEPTSGLDSDNSEVVVKVLKNLSASSLSPAIVATIHQPSVDVFMLFDNIYLLNRFGCNIYSGPPQGVKPFLTRFGFPERYDINPADYMIEVANAKYGDEKFEQMQNETQSISYEDNDSRYSYSFPIYSVRMKEPCSFLTQTWLLFSRDVQAYVFKSWNTIAKLVGFSMIAVIMSLMFEDPVGIGDGCYTTVAGISINGSTNEEHELKRTLFGSLNQQSGSFDMEKSMAKLNEQSMWLFSMILNTMFLTSMSTVMAFPTELQTVSKEISNHWYSPTAYYFAKMVSENIILACCMSSFVMLALIVGRMPFDAWRYSILFFVLFAAAAIWLARGAFFAIVFRHNLTLAILSTLVFVFYVMFMSGFYVKISSMNMMLRPFSLASDIRYAYELLLIVMFGFGKCQEGQATKRFMNNVLKQPNPMNQMQRLWTSINVTEQDMKQLHMTLELPTTCAEQLVNGLNNYFGPFEPLNQTDSSFMLQYFDVRQESFYPDVIFLVNVFLLSQISVYVALKICTRIDRL